MRNTIRHRLLLVGVTVFVSTAVMNAGMAEERKTGWRWTTAADKPAAGKPADNSRDTMVDLLVQLETLQTELRQLRNQVDLQTHEVDRLRKRLQALVRDLDRRLTDLEKRKTTAAPPVAPPVTLTAPSVARQPTPPVGSGTGRVSTGRGSPVIAAKPTPTTSGSQERKDYDAAFILLKQGYYERAADAFRGFIVKHPRSRLAGNAQYWVGEAHYVVRNFKLALEEFSKVERQYPNSTKVPDALLKIGYCYYELKEWKKADTALTNVVSRYPNTAVAKSAQGYLARLQKEKR
jgi:tol-pal system protein YbgF